MPKISKCLQIGEISPNLFTLLITHFIGHFMSLKCDAVFDFPAMLIFLVKK